jgi:2-polyprenyl-3-methyl-5-hydroxy-6-metoxy-1,4-benzoquinol methylase
MDTKDAYNIWAGQYDTNDNKTRDLEATALREIVDRIPSENVLEIGCGTGKNTGWLITKAKSVTAVDFSDEMLAKAREKTTNSTVDFRQADINSDWTFRSGLYDLVTFSLVLEHIENLEHVFRETSASLKNGGHVYLGELHPFKQYTGSKARFETGNGVEIVPCFNHHTSDFIQAAQKFGLQLVDLKEYFDGNDRSTIPRILCLVFVKDDRPVS